MSLFLRTEFATHAINRVINDIIKKNFNGTEPKNRCFISVISYCAEVKEEKIMLWIFERPL